jgi:hypothetical protein
VYCSPVFAASLHLAADAACRSRNEAAATAPIKRRGRCAAPTAAGRDKPAGRPHAHHSV